MTADKPIQIVCLLGTSRPGSYTSKALALVVDELGKDASVAVTVCDPAKIELAFPGGTPGKGVAEMVKAVEDATGLIVATPEYHGSPAAACKLIIENLGFPSALAGKPIALLGVAAGRIGAIKSLEMLRSILSHIGAIVLPNPVSVAGVQSVFDEDGTCTDAGTEKAVRGVASNLRDYIDRAVCPGKTLEATVREGG